MDYEYFGVSNVTNVLHMVKSVKPEVHIQFKACHKGDLKWTLLLIVQSNGSKVLTQNLCYVEFYVNLLLYWIDNPVRK